MNKVKYFIKETIERPVTKKEFLLRQKENEIGDCVSKAELLRGNTLTETQIKELIGSKVLYPIKYRSKIYFKVQEVRNGIKVLGERRKQEQTKLPF